MADIFVSYTRADQEIVRLIVALLEAQGWSVWWDTRISGGERWDSVIEREITAARCVVVVWTPQSIDREWVHLEAHHGRNRGILVPILIGVDSPPFAFSLIQARGLSGWDGRTETAAAIQFLTDVKQKLDGVSPHASPQLQPSTPPVPHAGTTSEAEREWRALDLDSCNDPGLLKAYAAKWETAEKLWSYKAQQKAAPLEAAERRRHAEERERQAREAEARTRAAEEKAGRERAAEAERQRAAEAQAVLEREALVERYRREGRLPVEPGAGKTKWFKDFERGPEMVVVPAGSFTMGEDSGQREVAIKAPFAVGRFAITFAEWDAAGLAHKPSDQGWGRGKRPVIDVSWEDAKSYAAWLSQKTGKAYRLLSEAEWEYCCRAGTTTKFAFGDTITHQQAQFSEGQYGSAKQTVEVGKFPPNAWGLHDMHGNVWEWCEDNWHADYKGAPQDGSVWQGGDATRRVLHGGSWNYGNPDFLRSANRFRDPPEFRGDAIGFRLARTL